MDLESLSKEQRDVGDAAEELVAQWFKSKGFWAFVVPKKTNGQPCDIIAGKGVEHKDAVFFVDAKHLRIEDKSFTFGRVEANQMTAMRLMELKGLKKKGFVIISEIDPSRALFLSYDRFIEETQKGSKSVKLESLEDMEEIICKYL